MIYLQTFLGRIGDMLVCEDSNEIEITIPRKVVSMKGGIITTLDGVEYNTSMLSTFDVISLAESIVVEEKNPVKSMPLVLSDDDGIRPAGKPDECFYCHQKVGTPHKRDCVILTRRIKVRYSYDVEIEVPYSWNKYDIEFHRNEGSWCANNSLRELKAFSDKIEKECSCLCNYFNCEVLEIPEADPIRRNKNDEILEEIKMMRLLTNV